MKTGNNIGCYQKGEEQNIVHLDQSLLTTDYKPYVSMLVKRLERRSTRINGQRPDRLCSEGRHKTILDRCYL